mmetsp:Transcript_45518/g.142966  ORF Transcript_45518/g.142966 Transcript_45518/m.142966 type:complete len:237 (-) Transcript_45518:389-1099(-)
MIKDDKLSLSTVGPSSDEHVARVWIRMHKTGEEDLTGKGFNHQMSYSCDIEPILSQRAELRDLDSINPFHGEHPSRRVFPQHRRDVEPFVFLEEIPCKLRVPRLDVEVNFLPHRLAHGLNCPVHGQVKYFLEAEHKEMETCQVPRQLHSNLRLLDLHCYRRPVRQQSPVNLSDRCGGDRLLVKLQEHFLRLLAVELLPEDPLHNLVAHARCLVVQLREVLEVGRREDVIHGSDLLP